MENKINQKQEFTYNSIDKQNLTYANQLTLNKWNDIINQLREQSNANTVDIECLYKWLVGTGTDEVSVKADSFSKFVLDKFVDHADRVKKVEEDSKKLQTDVTKELDDMNTSLQQKVTDEETRAKAVESKLQNAINTEYARAVTAEGVLTTDLNKEISRAKSTENRIEAKIDKHNTDSYKYIDEQIAEAKGYADSEIKKAVTSAYIYKGSVGSYINLPKVGMTIGDVYNVLDSGVNYAWNGEFWDDLAGIDNLNNYLEKTTAESTYVKQNGGEVTSTLNQNFAGFTISGNQGVAGIVTKKNGAITGQMGITNSNGKNIAYLVTRDKNNVNHKLNFTEDGIQYIAGKDNEGNYIEEYISTMKQYVLTEQFKESAWMRIAKVKDLFHNASATVTFDCYGLKENGDKVIFTCSTFNASVGLNEKGDFISDILPLSHTPELSGADGSGGSGDAGGSGGATEDAIGIYGLEAVCFERYEDEVYLCGLIHYNNTELYNGLLVECKIENNINFEQLDELVTTDLNHTTTEYTPVLEGMTFKTKDNSTDYTFHVGFKLSDFMNEPAMRVSIINKLYEEHVIMQYDSDGLILDNVLDNSFLEGMYPYTLINYQDYSSHHVVYDKTISQGGNNIYFDVLGVVPYCKYIMTETKMRTKIKVTVTHNHTPGSLTIFMKDNAEIIDPIYLQTNQVNAVDTVEKIYETSTNLRFIEYVSSIQGEHHVKIEAEIIDVSYDLNIPFKNLDNYTEDFDVIGVSCLGTPATLEVLSTKIHDTTNSCVLYSIYNEMRVLSNRTKQFYDSVKSLQETEENIIKRMSIGGLHSVLRENSYKDIALNIIQTLLLSNDDDLKYQREILSTAYNIPDYRVRFNTLNIKWNAIYYAANTEAPYQWAINNLLITFVDLNKRITIRVDIPTYTYERTKEEYLGAPYIYSETPDSCINIHEEWLPISLTLNKTTNGYDDSYLIKYILHTLAQDFNYNHNIYKCVNEHVINATYKLNDFDQSNYTFIANVVHNPFEGGAGSIYCTLTDTAKGKKYISRINGVSVPYNYEDIEYTETSLITKEDLNNLEEFTKDISVNEVKQLFAVATENETVSDNYTFENITKILSTRQRGCAYGNGYFVTLGVGDGAYSTDNGATWTAITQFTTAQVTSLAYGNGRFICVTANGEIYGCDVPSETWELLYTIKDTIIESIRYVNNEFIAVGHYGFIARSITGVDWKLIHLDEGVTTDIGYFNEIMYGNGKYIAIGYLGRTYISTNLRRWDEYYIPDYTTDVRCGAYVNGMFVIGTSGGRIDYSEDGINWKQANNPSSLTIGWVRDFAYGDNRLYVAVYASNGQGEIWLSEDKGKTWSVAHTITGSSSRLWRIAFGNDTFVSVGEAGTTTKLNLDVTWQHTTPEVDYFYKQVIVQNDGSSTESDLYYHKYPITIEDIENYFTNGNTEAY